MSICTPLPGALLAEWWGMVQVGYYYISDFTSPVTLSSISLSDRPVRREQLKNSAGCL
jgi:hypothetical protein